MNMRSIVIVVTGLCIGSWLCSNQMGLYEAVKNNNYGAAKTALHSGADPNQYVNGETPLFCACRIGCESIIHLLLYWRADPNSVCQSSCSPTALYELLYKACRDGHNLDGRYRMLERMLDYGAINNKVGGITSPEGLAEKFGFEDMAHLFVAYGASTFAACYQYLLQGDMHNLHRTCDISKQPHSVKMHILKTLVGHNHLNAVLQEWPKYISDDDRQSQFCMFKHIINCDKPFIMNRILNQKYISQESIQQARDYCNTKYHPNIKVKSVPKELSPGSAAHILRSHTGVLQKHKLGEYARNQTARSLSDIVIYIKDQLLQCDSIHANKSNDCYYNNCIT